MRTGDAGPSATISPASRVPSTRSAAGPTRTRTPSRGSWPPPGIVTRRWVLAPHGLDERPSAETRIESRSPQSVGIAAGEWCAFGDESDLPGDQRDDDAASLAFDSSPLTDRIEILGAPAV